VRSFCGAVLILWDLLPATILPPPLWPPLREDADIRWLGCQSDTGAAPVLPPHADGRVDIPNAYSPPSLASVFDQLLPLDDEAIWRDAHSARKTVDFLQAEIASSDFAFLDSGEDCQFDSRLLGKLLSAHLPEFPHLDHGYTKKPDAFPHVELFNRAHRSPPNGRS
jgi:hypothetical protein